MPELNEYPWYPVNAIWRNSDPEDRKDTLTEHIEDHLIPYENELMERLLLVRSEIDNAKQYLKELE